jgi:ABC-type lipoprotein release transport system permease subunit
MALGAKHADVLRLVMTHGSKLTAIGLVLGIGGALACTRLMKTLLFGVTAKDPLTFVGVAVVMACVAMAACYVPAHRAMRVEPTVALRHE